ncbi:uncharacterized protein GVI51_D03729 [Nakaseomyces glabratus]|nr:hypothetical protein J7298_00837 [Nakaseomyces glabratus]KAH7606523.1 hypothetical protein J7295_00840 [Nakaseomyces glabratus]KAH7608027.1 hypothetical protein J7293_00833 [Nakaseomyces glabratus]KAH7608433.1 hypothetical protein J7294_00832 [Nakaseomyces glabratus]KAH7614665.1 hypothetical protein J7292_00816 [Nakaseomyces glabratus]
MKDHDMIQLLQLLADYDALLEQLSKSMHDGFNNISRANYHNKDALRGKYGKDYWDDGYVGQVMAEVMVSGKVDIVAKPKPVNVPAEKVKDKEAEQLRNRKQTKKIADAEITEETNRTRDYDPILMFGGGLSTPQTLRNAQSNFKGTLPIIVKLLNCKNSINAIINEN